VSFDVVGRRVVGTVTPEPPDARARFRKNDAYRATREWQRLEGTAQRDLFRELRQRFLGRHPGRGPYVLDAGSGPGRFTAAIGPRRSRRVAADIGLEVLDQVSAHWVGPPVGPPLPDRIRADLLWPPFADGSFGTVAALGNLVGFAAGESEPLLDRLAGLVAPGGTLIVETAPAPGERSRYLARLPAGAVARLFRSPVRAVVGRIEGEGFARERARRRTPGRFRRWTADQLAAWCDDHRFEIEEVLALAPAIGADPRRSEAVARDRRAWSHLLEVEEILGRERGRWTEAAALLLSARRSSEG
jgi:SAM-dependent methyltransferase